MATVRDTLNGALQGRLEAALGRAAAGELLNLVAKQAGNSLERVGQFRNDDVAKSKTDVALTFQGTDATAPVDIVAPRAGRIVGISARVNAAVTASTITAIATIGGVGQAETAILTTTAQQKITHFKVPVAFAEGALLGIDHTTGVITPDASLELVADLLVEWGDQGAKVEGDLVPVANVVTLGATPKALIDVEATAGTTTGKKKIRRGEITGDNALVPATGEVIFNGTTGLLFAAVDAVTLVRAVSTLATDVVASSLQADVDQP